jgi:hypothetical protein
MPFDKADIAAFGIGIAGMIIGALLIWLALSAADGRAASCSPPQTRMGVVL